MMEFIRTKAQRDDAEELKPFHSPEEAQRWFVNAAVGDKGRCEWEREKEREREGER